MKTVYQVCGADANGNEHTFFVETRALAEKACAAGDKAEPGRMWFFYGCSVGVDEEDVAFFLHRHDDEGGG